MASQPGTATRLIGRRAEIDIIQNTIDGLMAGEGSLLLLSGEAGVGKSRLVSELVSRFGAAAPDGQVLTGNCFEGDHRLPFAPVLDLLRAFLISDQSPSPERVFDADPTTFVTLLPELQSRRPEIKPLTGVNPEQDRHRIFRTLLSVVNHLAIARPLLLVIEDLHWSDDTSLEFFVQLARSTQSSPVLIVGSFRSEEEHPQLRRALVEIERGRYGIELRIGQLTMDEVDLFLRDMFEQPYGIRFDFLRAIYDLTGGNPFFVEETMRSLVAEGDIYESRGRWTRKDLEQLRIPRSVQDALLKHTANLDDAALEVLESAAVIGQRCEFDLLQSITGYEDEALLSALRALIDAHLVIEETADRFRFRHALIRESVYARLLAWDRRARHDRVAIAIENLHSGASDASAAELAFHFHAAERWDKALEYGTTAGERALSSFTPYAAIQHFTQAIESVERLAQPPSAWLLRQRGRALETFGDFRAARHDFEAALNISVANGDRYLEWESLIDLGRSWEGLDYERAGNWFERALAVARKIDDPRVLAHNLNRLGTWYCNTERVDEARAAHLEALSIFEEVGDESGIAETFDYLGTVADIAGDLHEMRDRFSRAAVMFEELGDRYRLASVLSSMTVLSGSFVFEIVSAPSDVSHDQLYEWCSRGLHLAREAGWRAGEAYALMNFAGLHNARARYDEAFENIHLAIEIAREIDHKEWFTSSTAALGHLYQEILELDLAVECLAESTTLAPSSGSRHFLHVNSGLLIDSLVEQSQLDRAAEVLSGFSIDMPMQTIGQRRLWAARANWELACGSADRSLEIVDELFESGHNVESQRSIPLLAWRRGRALTQLGRVDEAEESLREAKAGSAALEHPGKVWKIQLELAHLYQLQRRATDASRELDSARAIVERIALSIPNEALKENFISRFNEMAKGLAGKDLDGPALFENLTPRERDVAALVARGFSNRRIADELFIGERTVETHVGNILSKLDFNSRTQIAAWMGGHSTSTSS